MGHANLLSRDPASSDSTELWKSDIVQTMRTMTATEAARSFAAVLDLAEHGETIVVIRGGRRVATISPAADGTWGAFVDALAGWTPSGDTQLASDIETGLAAATGTDHDPWTD
jgi:antitoxin (DNA-binding transcriptional repressor) of toxin-antitoxin stability system